MFRINHCLITSVLVFFVSACTTGMSENTLVESSQVPAEESKTYSNLNFGLLAPLIGEWQVQDWQLQQNGEWQVQAGATWKFYPIQGGMSLEDEWLSNPINETQVPGYGTHLRVFDPMSRKWQSAWLSSRSRTLEFYRGIETDSEVFFVSLPNDKGRITRTVFSNMQADFFNWRMEWSSDGGENWLMVYKVDASRIR